MRDAEPRFLDVQGGDGARRRIAYVDESVPAARGPGLVWLPGFNSTMTSTKASALAAWARMEGLPVLRFDYSGHGASGGDFTDGTVGRWMEDALAVLRAVAKGPQILVGSSMGGWIALLILRALARRDVNLARASVHAAVLIAPAWDMTETLFWNRFDSQARDTLMRDGVFQRPSHYGDGPYPITARLIEEGRQHLIAGKPFDPGVPVRILQGLNDPDVPWRHANALGQLLASDNIATLYIPDGDHRLSRPQDIARLIELLQDLYRDLGAAKSS